MEGLEAVRKLIQPGDFMMKLDLQDAYFSVPIHNSHKKYLRFVFQGITYEFQCLPFGLSSAPRTFTKLLKPVIVLLRIQGIRIVIYLDNIAYSGPKPRKTVVDFSECCQSTTTSGISHQTGEMLPSPIPVSRVPGILDLLEGDDTSCTQRQTPKAPNRVQECNPESLAAAERTLGFIRQNESLLPSGSSPRTFALSCSAEATYQQHSPEQTSLEQDKGLSDRRIPNRPPMVDFDADTSVQQEFNLTTSVRPGHLHRRVQSRMGSTERRCGLGFSSLQRTHRVDSGQGDLHTYSHKVLHSTSRLVCISAQSSTTPLCFPAPRPGCNGGRCNDIALEPMDIVHSCTNYNASSQFEENTRRSGNLSTHCPELAEPDMVSATIGDVGQHLC